MHHAVGVCRPRGSASPPGRGFGEENVGAGPSQPLLLGHEGGTVDALSHVRHGTCGDLGFDPGSFRVGWERRD